MYEAVFYNGWLEQPGYILINVPIEGATPEQARAEYLPNLTTEVRKMYNLRFEWTDAEIQENIYVLRDNALVKGV